MLGKVRVHIVDYPYSCEYGGKSRVTLFYLGQTKNNYVFLGGFFLTFVEKDDVCCFRPLV